MDIFNEMKIQIFMNDSLAAFNRIKNEKLKELKISQDKNMFIIVF